MSNFLCRETIYIEYTLTLITKNTAGQSLTWNLRYAGRTLASGKRKIPKNGIVKIDIEVSKLNQGVIAETEFTCRIEKKSVGATSQKLGTKLYAPAALQYEIKKSLYFFYPNPFKGEKRFLETRQIGVWEETEGGALSELLKSLQVPFAKVADPAQFKGKVLLASGVDFESSPSAFDTLFQLVKKGIKVIVMPPISGTFPVPIKQINEIKLGGHDYISGKALRGSEKTTANAENKALRGALDIRSKFDTDTWNGKVINTKVLNWKIDREKIILKIQPLGDGGFSYCELKAKKVSAVTGDQALVKEKKMPEGIMTIITWDIVNRAEESPTALYLLKEIIELE